MLSITFIEAPTLLLSISNFLISNTLIIDIEKLIDIDGSDKNKTKLSTEDKNLLKNYTDNNILLNICNKTSTNNTERIQIDIIIIPNTLNTQSNNHTECIQTYNIILPNTFNKIDYIINFYNAF